MGEKRLRLRLRVCSVLGIFLFTLLFSVGLSGFCPVWLFLGDRKGADKQ